MALTDLIGLALIVTLYAIIVRHARTGRTKP